MTYDKNTFNGLLCAGSLHEAVEYLEQFQEKQSLAKRMKQRITSEAPVFRSDNQWINQIDAIFQRYYKAVFWQGISREEGAQFLHEELMPMVDEDKLKQLFHDFFQEEAEEKYKDLSLRVSGIEELLIPFAEKEGYHYVGGETQGYFGPYIWKETNTETYQVELPVGTQEFSIQMMEGFISLGWLDYISLGKIGTGGWQSGGQLCCVKKSYEKQFEKLGFQISFLKHEAQHVYDLEHYPEISTTMLEYRAKLIELIYYPRISFFRKLLAQASAKDTKNSHSYAAYLIVHNLSRLVFQQDYVSEYSVWKRKLKDVQQFSRVCYDNFLEIKI